MSADIETLRARLTAAMRDKRRKGWTLAGGYTLARTVKLCCALGAVIDEEHYRIEDLHQPPPMLYAGRMLSLDPNDRDAIAAGFDGRALSQSRVSTRNEYYDLGCDLWAEAQRLNAMDPSEVPQ